MTDRKPSFSLKDQLFNRSKVEMIATQLSEVYPSFNRLAFIQDTTGQFPHLELKERIDWISTQLKTYLPDDYRASLEILLKSLPPECDPTLSDNDFGNFIYATYAHFVAKWGCTSHHLTVSLDALERITTRFSAEDAIRYFINAFPVETVAKMTQWTTHRHYHVRRLASEGSRPKLPWSQKINTPISDALPILNTLYGDHTRYVTRSVANHLNDISKLDPQLTLDLLGQWKQSNRQSTKEMAFIITHSLRTLVKKGDPRAMRFLNFSPTPQVTISNFHLDSPTVTIGEGLRFECTLLGEKPETVVIDYIIHFQNKSGQMANKKTYKLKQLTLSPGCPTVISKTHLFRANMSTRTVYPGAHQVDIQINGNIVASGKFEIISSD